MVGKQRQIWIGILVILLISLPYLYAYHKTNSEWIFGGFLLNPIDGHSYLAKMQQGFSGNWKFVLPYTAEPGEGAYLFLLYILLGQMARLLKLPLLVVFHAARLIGSLFLLFTLWRLFTILFKEKWSREAGFALVCLGSGLGWLGILGGLFTSDFWVAEAYPFLSMYANPHFPIGLGLMILALLTQPKNFFLNLILGIAVAFIQPFLVVVLLGVNLGMFFQDLLEMGKINLRRISQSKYLPGLVGAGLGGGLLLLYQFGSIISDPILKGWNKQNLTPPPGILDLLISFSPVIIVGVLGIKEAWKGEVGKKIVIWSLVSAFLLFIPWNLQRRFMTGLYVPLAALAIYGLKSIIKKGRMSYSNALILIFFLVVPTNLIVLISGIQAAKNLESTIYYPETLKSCLEWISQNTSPRALILADENAGLLIPSQTGRRVIYGHPFETVPAEKEFQLVEDFYNGSTTENEAKRIFDQRQVDYLLINKSQNGNSRLGNFLEVLPISYENSDLILYQLTSP